MLITWPCLHVTVIEMRISVFLSEFATTGSTYFTHRYISQTNEVGYPMPDLRYPKTGLVWVRRGTVRQAARRAVSIYDGATHSLEAPHL